MDKPDLVVCCVVGDGESETGPTAGAWHASKFIDPKESGAVLPILHVNGFKISERTIPGVMDDKELLALYSGYGYAVALVEDLENIDDQMAQAMDWALGEIRSIQKAARSGKPMMKPRWPILILRTPKGWGCPKELDGVPLEGSYKSHQVPLAAAKSDGGQLQSLQSWLASYNPKDILGEDGSVASEILEVIPTNDAKKIGQILSKHTVHQPLKVPEWQSFALKKGDTASCMKTIGKFIDQTVSLNPHSIRLFSPDELVSNKLDAVLEHTSRNFQWDEYSHAQGGRVIEMLSEHTLQGFLQVK